MYYPSIVHSGSGNSNARMYEIRTYSVDGESNGIEKRSVGISGSVPMRYKERFGSQKS